MTRPAVGDPELGSPLPDRRIRTRASRPPVDPRLLRLDPAVGWLLGATGLLAVVTAAALIVQAAALAAIIVPTFLEGAVLADHGRWLVVLIAAIVVRAAATWSTDLLGQRTAARVKSRLRAAVVDELTRRPPGTGERSTGELAGMLTDGIDALDGTFGGYLPALVRGLVIPIAIVVVLLRVELTSAIILLVTLPLIPIFMVLVGLAARGATRRRFRALTELSGHLLGILRGLTTIRVIGAVDRVATQVRDAAQRLRRTTLQTLRVAFLSALVLELLAALAVATVAVIAGVRLAEGFGDLQPVFMALLLAPEAFWPLRQVGQQFHANEDGAAASDRLLGLLDDAAESPADDDRSPADAGPTGTAPAAAASPSTRHPAGDPARVTVRLEGIQVTYPGRQLPAVDGVDLDLTPGELIAVVGASGAGKTTLASVLLGLRPPDDGQVTVGGVDIAQLDAAAWHARLAWVPQEPARLPGTLREVVTLGVDDAARPDDHAIIRALHEVGLDAEVAALPEGLDTRVGAGGRGLSAGQWRRVALARALLRDAGLVVLDEPTGDLDVDAERAVRDALDRLRGQRTVVVLTHRVALTADADRVVVLDDGRIVDEGSPRALLAARGPYAALVDATRPLDLDEVASREPPVTDGVQRAREPDVTEDRAGDEARPTIDVRASDPATPAWRTVVDVLRQLLRPHRRMLAVATAAGTITPLSGVLLVAISTYLISVTALRPNLLDLTVVIVSVRALSLLKGVSRYVERIAGHDVALRVVVDLRGLAYTALVPKAPVGLAGHRIGDLLARVVSDVERLQLALVRGVVPMIGGVLAGLATVVVATLLLPAAGPVVLVGLAVAGVVVPLLAWRTARTPERRLARARGALAGELVEVLDAAPELRLLDRLEPARRRLDALDDDLVRLDRSTIARGGGADAGVQLVLGATVVGLVLVGVPAVTAGSLDGVLLGALVVLGLSAAEAVAPLPLSARALTTAGSATTRLLEVLAAPDPAPDPAPTRDATTGSDVAASGDAGTDRGAAPTVDAAPTVGARLRLSGVTASYPGAATPVVHDLDLEVAPGRRIAVVGRSGAGKSTLAHLTVRFLDPHAGTVTLDGIDLRSLRGAEVRRRVGLAPQSAHLFDGTVATNLRLAVPGATTVQLRRALAEAHLDAWVDALPDGMETEVGDGGSRLSGGQRSRLALARTLLLRTPLVVLDEPTADLDPITARGFLADALRAAADRGVLLLTHDLRALPVVDEVVVLEAGRIVARGPHDALLATDDDYAARWALDRAAVR